MNYEEANQVLNNTKYGIFEPTYKVTQALIITGDIDRAIENEQHPEGLVKLSKRQKQLLVLVDAGLSNESIANRLEISAHTVKVHLWRFYKKLGISSRTQLVKIARDNGYL